MTAKKPVKPVVKKATKASKAVAKGDVSEVPSPPAVVVSEGPVSAPVPSDAADNAERAVQAEHDRLVGAHFAAMNEERDAKFLEDRAERAVAEAQRALAAALSEQSEATAQLLEVKERLRVAQQTVQYARDDLRRAEVQR